MPTSASASRRARPARSTSGPRGRRCSTTCHAPAHGGTFILRLEDTDVARSSIAYEKDILDGLHWLGLRWDEGPEVAGEAARGPHAPYRQMERLPLYAEAAERLLAEDKAYHCYCTPEELDAERKRLGGGEAAASLQRTVRPPDRREERAAFEAEGRRPAIRFRVGEGIVAFDDLVRGHVEIDVGEPRRRLRHRPRRRHAALPLHGRRRRRGDGDQRT